MKTGEIIQLLRDYESRNVLFTEPDGSWPIVWERARGVHVWDTDGKKYLDLTAAFGVAAAGHANPRVVKAGQQQMARLPHAMGDVHPHALKAELARELSRITYERWSNFRRDEFHESPKSNARLGTRGTRPSGKVIFTNSGFEAVEAALKTALLATGKNGVIAFEGAYHGLGYGALNATHREHFRHPFRAQLREFACFAPFPGISEGRVPRVPKIKNGDSRRSSLREIESRIRRIFRRKNIGAILVEPVQARGGINVPPPEFLPLLRKLCDEFGALLIADEIYTGFGHTGKWFACEHGGGTGVSPVSPQKTETHRQDACATTIPDLICLGKALTGGFPLSACVGRADLMDAAWPVSRGEAIHTSTFLGNPVGCAMALAQIAEIERLKLPERAAKLGKFLLGKLESLQSEIPNLKLEIHARGLGLMAGVELRHRDGSPATAETFGAIKTLLQRGFIFLPEGEHGNVISFTPPLTITKAQLARTVAALTEVLGG
jgi:4-aminobutyrate aminotransferase-like enzyme